MASALARSSAIDLLEDAVDLLRAAPLTTLVFHWIGSVPFVLALLFFWHDMTSAGARNATCATEALALALLLGWMNCWRAVFAGRLGRQLALRTEPRWNWRRVGLLISSQVFLGGTKLVVLPLAIVITLPLASAVAFYRNAAMLGDRDDLDMGQLIAKARKLATPDQRQGWIILLLLTVLYLALAANLALLLALAPQLARILTGYESVFSRGGSYFVRNSLFWVTVLAIAWLLFDPFVQAVYGIRYFRLESRETGEDLRAALHRIVLLALVVLAPILACAAPINPAELDQAIHQTMQSSKYQWHTAPAAPGSFASSARAALRSVGEVIDRFVNWLRHSLSPPAGTAGIAPPATALHRSIYLLIAMILILVAAMVWRVRRKYKLTAAPAVPGAAVDLQAESLLANELLEDRWLAFAESCVMQRDFRSALRALYLANLAWLGRGEWIAIHSGKTNHEYELELRRRARGFPDAFSLFAANIASFESTWYGSHEATGADIQLARQRLERMKTAMTPAELAL